MDSIANILDFITIFISVIWLIRSVQYIVSKPRYLAYLLFFIFYVFPLILDFTLGLPEYEGDLYYGFNLSSTDNTTRIIYDTLLLSIQWLLLRIFEDKRFKIPNISTSIEIKKTWLYIGMLLAPLITIILDREFNILYVFQWREIGLYDVPRYYFIAEPCTYVGISTALFVLVHIKNKNIIDVVFSIIFLYVNICIEGKRAILMFLLVNISIILALKYIETKRTRSSHSYLKLIPIVAIVAMFVLYMISVSATVMAGRGFDESDRKKMQMLTRVDFLRDDRIRMAIYSELYPEKIKILDHKCQTLYYNLIYTFPINLIYQDSEAGSYQEYFSSALRGENFSKRNNYMTTSVWAELISNFGLFLGTILMLLLTIQVARLVEAYKRHQSLSSMFLSAFVMINMFTFAYIIIYLEFLFLLCYNVSKRPKMTYCQEKI